MKRTILPLLIIITSLIPVLASCNQTWSTAELVSGSTAFISHLDSATDSAGDLHAVWGTIDINTGETQIIYGLWNRVSWTTEVVFAETSAGNAVFGPMLLFNAAGQPVLVWRAFQADQSGTRISTRINGNWSTPSWLNIGSAITGDLALAQNGDLYLTTVTDDQARIYQSTDSGATWTNVHEINNIKLAGHQVQMIANGPEMVLALADARNQGAQPYLMVLGGSGTSWSARDYGQTGLISSFQIGALSNGDLILQWTENEDLMRSQWNATTASWGTAQTILSATVNAGVTMSIDPENVVQSVWAYRDIASGIDLLADCGSLQTNIGELASLQLNTNSNGNLLLWIAYDATNQQSNLYFSQATLPEAEAWYSTNEGCNRVDIVYPQMNFGSTHRDNIRVYDAVTGTDLGLFRDYHINNPSCNLYYPGDATWTNSYYRFHGDKPALRQAGLPQWIKVRFVYPNGQPYSTFSNSLNLGPLP